MQLISWLCSANLKSNDSNFEVVLERSAMANCQSALSSLDIETTPHHRCFGSNLVTCKSPHVEMYTVANLVFELGFSLEQPNVLVTPDIGVQ